MRYRKTSVLMLSLKGCDENAQTIPRRKVSVLECDQRGSAGIMR